jgi:hypothetical protein
MWHVGVGIRAHALMLVHAYDSSLPLPLAFSKHLVVLIFAKISTIRANNMALASASI